MERVDVQLHPLPTSALNGCEWSTSRLLLFYFYKQILCTIKLEVGWASEPKARLPRLLRIIIIIIIIIIGLEYIVNIHNGNFHSDEYSNFIQGCDI